MRVLPPSISLELSDKTYGSGMAHYANVQAYVDDAGLELLPEQERLLRLDDEAERKILAAAAECKWRPKTMELFRDIVMLARDTGMRNEKELYRIRIEDIGWDRQIDM